ncbi:MAG TPA: serine hydrolase [Pyrinomonadaceae bacterium]|jgi:CubicO group peptidase (beta-lactamase class C family)
MNASTSSSARVRAALVLCLLLLFPAPRASAQQPQRQPPTLSAEKIKQIEALVAAEMARQKIPGMSVAVVAGGRPSWAAGFGMQDIENDVPARASTVYRLGSISKPVTAVAVMQLFERGRLDLDAPVQKYCPAFPEKQWPVTTRQLLGHLSGIRHYKSDEEFNSTRFYASVAEGLAMFKDDPLLFEPGTKYSYTTHGYSVLGCVVEGASGRPFADFVRENVSGPAGAERLRVDSVADIIKGRAQGYRITDKGALTNSPLADNSYKVPGGGFVSTVEDLAKLAAALQAGKLLKRETAEMMYARQKLKDGKETSYGLGWGVGVRPNGQRAIGHSGGQQRVSTFLHMQPDEGLAVVLMSNLEGARLGDLSQQIGDIVLAPSGAGAQAGAAGAGAASVEQTLVSNEKRTWELYKNKDVKGLAELTAEDYYDIYPTGEGVDKKRYLADVLETEVKDYALSDFKVIVLNEAAAVVVYRAKVHGATKEREIKSEVAVTSGWAKRGGRWLNVFYRESAVEVNGKRIL